MLEVRDVRDEILKRRNPHFPKIPKRPLKVIKFLIFHTPAGDSLSGKNIWELVELDIKKKPIFSYHFLIEKEGSHYIGWRALDYRVLARHSKGWNTYSVSLAFNSKGRSIGERDLEAIAEMFSVVLLELAMKPSAETIRFHRELPNEGYEVLKRKKKYLLSCPGWEWDYEDFLAEIIEHYQSRLKGIQRALKRLKYYDGRVDGHLSPKFIDSVKRYKEENKLKTGYFLEYELIKKLESNL
jgi:hypothetical protein